VSFENPGKLAAPTGVSSTRKRRLRQVCPWCTKCLRETYVERPRVIRTDLQARSACATEGGFATWRHDLCKYIRGSRHSGSASAHATVFGVARERRCHRRSGVVRTFERGLAR